jgi:hypothetical protein
MTHSTAAALLKVLQLHAVSGDTKHGRG